MIEHLVAEHKTNKLSLMSHKNGWGVCSDCEEYFKAKNLPMGFSDWMWCHSCAQERCLNYSELRSQIREFLRTRGITVPRKASNEDIAEAINQLIEKMEDI
ncbi:MAG: hypothetical protein Q8P37_01595 [Candidatus Spechtbacteria bacterium]|nr:hypothetical protein [Candidatus Spechtbacteria bacterium]